MDIRTWLTHLGLQRYADAFEENEVTVEDLPDLTPADLKDELGVKKLIDRKKLLAAIAEPRQALAAEVERPGPPEWPTPIQCMLDRSFDTTEGAVFQHQQLLYALGAVLRTTAAILAARYLACPSSRDDRLDSYLLTDLRRPTYGNLVGFLRACSKTKSVDWGAIEPLAAALRAAFKRRGHGLADTRDPFLIGGLIEYRNRFAHGVAALSSSACEERLPSLKQAIVDLLACLEVLKGIDLSADGASLTLLGTEVPMSPLAHGDGYPCVAIMEGYNTRKGSLHYVSPERTWDCKEGWELWRAQLQERGLLPVAWEHIGADWLTRRALASVPARYRLPDAFVPDADELDAVSCCVEPGRPIHTSDVALTTALLQHLRRHRFCFVVDEDEYDDDLSAHDIASQALGAARSIGELPEGHPLEVVLEQTTFIFPQPPGTLPRHDWQRLADDFRGIEVLEVRPGGPDQTGLTYDPAMYEALYNAIARRRDQPKPWQALSPDARAWVSRLERVRFMSRLGRTLRETTVSPMHLWRTFLDDALQHYRLDPVELLEASQPRVRLRETRADSILKDVGLVRMGPSGAARVVDEGARAAIIGVALAGMPPRSRNRLVAQLDVPVTPELGATLTDIFANEPLPHSSSVVWQAVVAHCACTAPERLARLTEGQDPNDPLKLCAVLISWGRPDAVDALVRAFRSPHDVTATVQNLRIASAVRTHGSPELAAELFSALASPHTAHGIQAMHQWAGVLRDRKNAGDQEAAAALYEQILTLHDLAPAQLVRTCCGAAENAYEQHKFDACHRYLDRAETAASQLGTRQQALVHHRRAAARAFEGDEVRALEASQQAVTLLGPNATGAFASRCFNTHAECLHRSGDGEAARHWLEKSLRIKRALGDRLGLQTGLLLMATLRARSHPDDAIAAAEEALRLARAAHDTFGELAAHYRLKRLTRKNPDRRAAHIQRIHDIETQLNQRDERAP